MAVLFLMTALVLGAALALELRVKLHGGELASLAIALGVLLGTWLLWSFVVLFGYGAGAWVCLGVQATLGGGLLLRRVVRRRAAAGDAEPISWRPAITWCLFTLISLAILWPLFSSHMLEPRRDGWHSGGWTAVDLLHHMAFAARFSVQSAFTFDSPLAAGEPLTYPFMIDFLAGSLMRMGWTARMSFLVPGLLLTLACAQLLFFLGLRLFERARAGIAAVLLFFFNGSAFGLWFFRQDWHSSGESLPWFLGHMKRQYAQLGGKDIHLGNFICNAVLPQRGAVLGLAVFLVVLLLLLVAREREGRHRTALLLAAGGLTGLLPFSHVHTFVVAVAILGWFALTETIARRSPLHAWSAALAAAVVVAAPQLWWQTSAIADSFVRIHVGWLNKADESLVVFWFKNLGLGALFLVGNLWLIWRLRSPFHWRLYVPLLVLFAICNLVALQPLVYDNSKIFYYVHLGVALYAAGTLSALSTKGWPGAVGAALVLLAMTLVGGISVLRESYASARVYRTAELRLASALDGAVPPDARILAVEKNPVPFLAGRGMVLGLRQTLVNHGVKVGPLERDARQMLKASPAAMGLLCRHGVTHVLLGSAESKKWEGGAATIPARRIDLGVPPMSLFEIDLDACDTPGPAVGAPAPAAPPG
jgi:hypothetical protein